MKKYAFGVDIGGTTVKMGLFETTGELLEVWEIPTRTIDSGKHILGDIARAADEKLAEREIPKDGVEGIGMGVPGPVGADGTVFKCVNLGWGVFRVTDELAALTGLKVRAGNDANVAALGEMWLGAGKGFDSLVMVTLGTGVGSGVVIDGHILPGKNGAAGEIGHMPVEPRETEVCSCGKKGCLEQYTSATGLVRMMKKYLADHMDEKTVLREGFSAKDVFDAAREGDGPALAAVDEMARMLGKGLAAAACVTDPDLFVVGGGVANAGDFLLDKVRRYYRENAFHASAGTPIVLAQLGNSAGIYGGVRMVIGD